MKVKNLNSDINLQDICIKLTPELQKAYADYCSKGEDEMYLVGSMMGDWFISPVAPTTESRRLYPMPLNVNPSDFLECEIIEKLTEEQQKLKDECDLNAFETM